MTIREWLMANGSKYNNKHEMYDACAKELRVARKTVINKASDLKGGLPFGGSAKVASKPAKGIMVSDFLHNLDYPAQLRQAIKQNCGDCFLPEAELRTLTKLNTNAFRSAVNTGEFQNNQFKVDGLVYWSTEANVKKAKDMKGIA